MDEPAEQLTAFDIDALIKYRENQIKQLKALKEMLDGQG